MRAAARVADLLGDLFELGLSAGCDQYVCAGLGERQRHGGAEAPAGAGHHGHLIVESEPVENHARHRNKNLF
ncbi:hypothetical protein GCM10027535_57440 [Mycolicibacterium hippocampi]|uniref:Uncharacterized protein n=1 Tax=Mycolicibacterium hippocampi TaxID=659824 RepID=A0A7I9ZVH4_9MYCO|nr:hypothetical protein MHIP_54980 [Mycolicibacterium hippocampi]